MFDNDSANATSWRDLADELTEQERSAIEQIEQAFAASGYLQTAEARETLIGYARDQITAKLADAAFCDVPVPAGVTFVGGWEKNLKRDGWSRSLLWRKFRYFDIDGSQQCDGSYTCQISLYDVRPLSVADAKELARALFAAADELAALL